MSMGSPRQWVDYLIPDDAKSHKLVAFSHSGSTDLSDVTKFDQLMVETRAVLSRYCHFLSVSREVLGLVESVASNSMKPLPSKMNHVRQIALFKVYMYNHNDFDAV